MFFFKEMEGKRVHDEVKTEQASLNLALRPLAWQKVQKY